MRATCALLVALAGVSAHADVEASASATQPRGYWGSGPVPFTDYYREGSGTASLDVIDKVVAPGGLAGDWARLSATFTIDGDTYTVTLDQVGVDPRNGFGLALAGRPISGGVVLDTVVHGDSPLGSWTTTPALATISVFGRGTVTRSGRTLTDRALVTVFALAAGTHADDNTHRLLPEGRWGDSELLILATELPVELIPSGFIEFTFEEVQITRGGESIPNELFLPAVTPRLPEEVGGIPRSERAASMWTGVGFSAPQGSPPPTTIEPLPPGTEVRAATPGTSSAPPGTTSGTGTPVTGGPEAPIGQQVTPGTRAAASTRTPAVPGTATELPTTPAPANASPATPLIGPAPTPENPTPATPTTPAPANSSPGTPLIQTPAPGAGTTAPAPTSPAPANAAPALPLIQTPPPLNTTPR